MARRKKQQAIHYSFVKVLTGSDLSNRRLAVMEATGTQEGPAVWLTACVHGDEVGGIAVIQEIFKRLRKHPLKKGSLHAFPLMNPIGFENASRVLPVSQEDLNRSFPGDTKGTLAERIAYKIFNTILATKPALVIDLHNDWIRSIPYTLIDPHPGREHATAYKSALTVAKEIGFALVNEQEDADDADDLRRSLSGSLIMNDIPALTLELGGSYIVNERDVEAGVNGIWKALAHLELVDHVETENTTPARLADEAHGILLSYSHRPTAQTSGILRTLAKPGSIIREGEPLARIYNVFGKLEETILATHDAVILGYSDSAAAVPGKPVVALGIIEKQAD